ncbi:hypothetical protein [Brachybacterium sp. UMB0905]|uniref:hypothetical protein n=1 Tax=Brachybacterium sp. UMB0905 TaxID=2069310 RepID=UPI000C804BCF|nr:hypothetical protein [Brachybacterium sp. UMB0905]PMC76821.1 hypothetical protein CJ197_00380 [Brachybacterium sp. UMB0905]
MTRTLRSVTAVTAALLLLGGTAGCGLLPLGEDEPAPTAGPTNGPTGDPEDFVDTCTRDGRLSTRGSTQGRDTETKNSRGEHLFYGAVMIRAEGADGEPAAVLRVQADTGDAEDLDELGIGDTAEFDEWTLTIRSICADSVGFDADVDA